MLDRRIFVYICCLVLIASEKPEYNQEMAKIVYVNSKYVRDVSVFTMRRGRASPYLTTFNGTSLNSWGNNVTVRFSFKNAKFPADVLAMDFKVCEGLHFHWLASWVKSYSDLPFDKCPIPKGSYHFHEVQLPPKNFPFVLLSGEYIGYLKAFLTQTKEEIIELSVRIRVKDKRKI